MHFLQSVCNWRYSKISSYLSNYPKNLFTHILPKSGFISLILTFALSALWSHWHLFFFQKIISDYKSLVCKWNPKQRLYHMQKNNISIIDFYQLLAFQSTCLLQKLNYSQHNIVFPEKHVLFYLSALHILSYMTNQ